MNLKFCFLFSFLLLVFFSQDACCLENWQNLGLYGGKVAYVTIYSPSNSHSSDNYALDEVYVTISTHNTIHKASGHDGGWTKLGFTSDYDYTINGIAVTQDNGNVYLATSSALFRSTDGGSSWSPIYDIQNARNVRVTANNTIFCNAYYDASDSQLYYSSDQGTTWSTVLTESLEFGSNFEDLSVYENADGTAIYVWAAVTIDDVFYLYRCYYNGSSWTQETISSYTEISDTFEDFMPQRVTVDPNNPNTIFIKGITPEEAPYLIKTTEATADSPTFTQVNIVENEADKVYFADSNVVYCRNYKSIDAGANWTILPDTDEGSGFGSGDIVIIHPRDDNIIYTKTDRGVARSLDAGESFSGINNGLQAVEVEDVVQAPNDENTIIIASECGLARSTDSGSSWTWVQSGTSEWTCLATDSRNGRIYAGNNGAIVSYSDDNGATWTVIEELQIAIVTTYTGIPIRDICPDPFSALTIYVAVSDTTEADVGALYKVTYSEDTSEWTCTELISSTPILAVHAYDYGASVSNPRIIVSFGNFTIAPDDEAATGAGLQVSNDGGTTWETIEGSSDYIWRCLTQDPNNSDVFYAGTGYNGCRNRETGRPGTVFKSTDGGLTWTDVYPNSAGNLGVFRDVVVDPNDSNKVYAAMRNIIYYSPSAGNLVNNETVNTEDEDEDEDEDEEQTSSWEEHYVGDTSARFLALHMMEGEVYANSLSRAYRNPAGISAQTTDYSLSMGAETGAYVWGTSTSWYFAEGCTTSGYDTWLLLSNPNSQAATVTVTYYTPSTTISKNYTIGATSRYSIHVDTISGLEDTDVSMKIEVTNNVTIAAERAMYWNNMTKGHDTIGVTSTSQTWYFAEGSTADYNTYILLLNPNSSAANVALTFMKTDGTNIVHTVTVPANSRYTVNTSSLSTIANANFATKVDSDLTIVAERAVYWNNMSGGHCSIGTTTPSSTWYLTEGYTGGTYNTWILIQNPGDGAATCTVTFYVNGASSEERTYIVGGKSRYSIHVDNILSNHEVSTFIDAGTSQVVAERAMYWGSGTSGDGHCTIGAKTLSQTWYLAEGCTAEDFDEFILLMNPNSTAATVTVNYLKTDGTTVTETYTVPAQSRFTIHTDNISGLESASFSASITATIGIAVERAMYFGGTGGHVSRGLSD